MCKPTKVDRTLLYKKGVKVQDGERRGWSVTLAIAYLCFNKLTALMRIDQWVVWELDAGMQAP